jgi:hypothetical protein
VTGNYQRAPHYRQQAPDNVTFTGYIDKDAFIGLMRGADAIMDLTTRDNTVLMGAYEAISLEQPLITSDWPILRSYFPIGTVHIDNSVAGIVEGIQTAQTDHERLARDIQDLHVQLMAEWDQQFGQLRQLIADYFLSRKPED